MVDYMLREMQRDLRTAGRGHGEPRFYGSLAVDAAL